MAMLLPGFALLFCCFSPYQSFQWCNRHPPSTVLARSIYHFAFHVGVFLLVWFLFLCFFFVLLLLLFVLLLFGSFDLIGIVMTSLDCVSGPSPAPNSWFALVPRMNIITNY